MDKAKLTSALEMHGDHLALDERNRGAYLERRVRGREACQARTDDRHLAGFADLTRALECPDEVQRTLLLRKKSQPYGLAAYPVDIWIAWDALPLKDAVLVRKH
jgi:hypothetical protein